MSDVIEKPAPAEIIKRPTAVPAEPTLSDLASRIKSDHARLIESNRNILQSAISIGENLLKAKDQVGHGGFLKWVKDNCDLSDKTAERYMKFAKNKNKLIAMEKVKFETISNLTLNEAERMIDGDGDNADGKNGSSTGGKGKGKGQNKRPPPKVYHTLQEKLIDALREFTSVEHAEEYAEKTKNRLDTTIEGMRKEAATERMAA